jgi:CheY-like chemotaxis protein
MTQLVRLLDDLLDVSRITSGKFELRRAPCELREIIDVAVEGTHILIEELGHHFLVSLPSEPLRLNADLVRVAQIIGNLIGNAAKYTPAGGEIALIAERDGDWIDIRVSDNGIGMEPEILGEIFELFSQAQHAELRRRGGIGVGLALARSLTEMHGGFLRADSKGRGAGSTFTLRLPLLTTALQPATTDANAMAPTLRKRVLILDDNVDAAKTLGHLLTLMGHDIVLAHTGLDAVSIAQEFHPQIALLDIGLPDIDGHEVARRIRQANLDTLLVAVTGWGAEADRENSLKAGFDVHLTKPVSLTEINALL